jgi:NADH:ubiquinone oxidoreductase subunit 4 (subunit M)
MSKFIFHSRFPRAHIEAPVPGSIIFVGVLLKLGGYGLLRIFPVLLKFGFAFSFCLDCFEFGWWFFC